MELDELLKELLEDDEGVGVGVNEELDVLSCWEEEEVDSEEDVDSKEGVDSEKDVDSE